MADRIAAQTLNSLLTSKSKFALIDVRESGEYNNSHIPGASLIPRRRIENIVESSVPSKGVHIVVCDDDGQRSPLAASTLERLGYTHVSILDGGVNRWSSQDYPTEWGVNVPSKEFGEKLEVVHDVPKITAEDLHQRINRGDKLVILDTRTPEEYHRFCIPGGRSMPGGELAFRITDITNDLDEDTTVIVNCAGRTRSITGTRVLQRMGIPALGLKNGTSGWLLAGYELENGADRLELPQVSAEGETAANAYAARLAEEDGVRYLDVAALQKLMANQDSQPIYLIDVRTEEEYSQGHVPGFRWWPGGQAVQRADDVAVVKNATIVFCCDGRARSTVTASLYRQMGIEDVYAVEGGTSAWGAAGHSLETGMPPNVVAGLAEAQKIARMVSPEELNTNPTEHILFVDTSQDFSRAHVAGATWISRSWLEIEISGAVPSKTASVTVTCNNGRGSALAAATLQELGYSNVQVLDGGMAGWQKAGLPIEKGLTGIVRPPADINYLGVDRSYAEMMNYLRWETELGAKYASS